MNDFVSATIILVQVIFLWAVAKSCFCNYIKWMSEGANELWQQTERSCLKVGGFYQLQLCTSLTNDPEPLIPQTFIESVMIQEFNLVHGWGHFGGCFEAEVDFLLSQAFWWIWVSILPIIIPSLSFLVLGSICSLVWSHQLTSQMVNCCWE